MSRLRSAKSLCRRLRQAHGCYLPLQTPVLLSVSTKERGTCAHPAGLHQQDWRCSLALTSSFRSFATSTVDDQSAIAGKRASEAMAVLKHAKLGKLREKLQQESETVPYITKDRLLQLIQESDAVSRPEDAEQTCHALNDSGQVLLYQNKAYLRPAEVAEMVLQALPDTTKDLEDKLTILQRELQPLEDTKQDVDKRAHMRSNLVLWGGLAGVMAVWGVCFRLTFWELSWDVMEPITYFIGSGTGIAFYLYFLATQREFAYREWKNQMMTRLQAEGYARKHLDMSRYNKLKKDIERYKRYLYSDTIANNVKSKAA
ncbi:hypothetical protein ABBQ38_005579 [Trebouxia sp. C0009 RCD-2024]